MDTIDSYEIYRIILLETGYGNVLGRMSRNSEVCGLEFNGNYIQA